MITRRKAHALFCVLRCADSVTKYGRVERVLALG